MHTSIAATVVQSYSAQAPRVRYQLLAWRYRLLEQPPPPPQPTTASARARPRPLPPSRREVGASSSRSSSGARIATRAWAREFGRQTPCGLVLSSTKLSGPTHSARNRWLAEVVLPSVDAAAKFHAKCAQATRLPRRLLAHGRVVPHAAAGLKTRFPSWLHIFTSRAAAADGAKRVLLDQRRCEWLTFVRLDADDMLTQEAFERIEQSATVSKGDVTVHGAVRRGQVATV